MAKRNYPAETADRGLADRPFDKLAIDTIRVTIGWDRYIGASGAMIGMHTFGSSAPLKDLLGKFGFTPEKVMEAAREQIAKSARPA